MHPKGRGIPGFRAPAPKQAGQCCTRFHGHPHRSAAWVTPRRTTQRGGLVMAWRKLASFAAALVACGGLGVAGVIASAGPAAADGYGPTAVFQVEISANIHALAGNGSGGGIWFWAALSSDHTADYQETDCVHNVPGASNGAVHNSTDTATWADNGGTLTISGVQTALGPVNITVPDTIGHYVYPNSLPPLFGPTLFSALPAQVQVAP